MLKKSLTSLSTVAMLLIVAVALLFGWSKTGWKALAVPTGSMEPNISVNSLVFVHTVDTDSLGVGDIITYMNPSQRGKTISHRIIKVSILDSGVRSFVTKGDANPSADIPITSGSVVGKVTAHVPYLGSLLIGTKTWIGIAIAVYIPAILLMIEEVRRLAEYLRTMLPYKLYGYKQEELQQTTGGHALIISAGAAASLILVSGLVFAVPAFALLSSNTVALSPNTLRVASPATPPTNGGTSNTTCTNNTNVNVTNTSNQTATSSSANNSGNTTGGNATSGNASNSNSSTVNIGITNGGC